LYEKLRLYPISKVKPFLAIMMSLYHPLLKIVLSLLQTPIPLHIIKINLEQTKCFKGKETNMG
jgi:hypothetical protein